ncbi:MAG: GTPase-activating protein [Pycnora praestabilis]|nr:MAG: GTPase-activating protein [Pycnora praestabilis]
MEIATQGPINKVIENRLSSADMSDREGETFEDAPDSAPQPFVHESSRPSSSRSLTRRRPSSSSKTTPRNTTSGVPTSINSQFDGSESFNNANDNDQESRPPNSPLLTSHRLSTASLDDVSLEEGTASARSRTSTITSRESSRPPAPPPKLPPRSSETSILKSKGLSESLPSVPWGPPPQPPEKTKLSTPAPPPSRKLTSPFSWLSRNTSATAKEANPPPVPTIPLQMDQRNTASSVAINSGNPDLMLSRIEDGDESDGSGHVSKRPGRNSLRDRFKLLRMREEAGITSLGAEDAESPTNNGGAIAALIGHGAGIGLGVGSPTSLKDEQEGGLAGQPSASAPPPSASPRLLASNSGMAPGTVSGMSAGPSAMTDPAIPVDWDLWQSVVYEGPTAVARTSPEELNRAISSGIPSAIRGVVWQVVAQSKNEELEGVYRDLVARGTDKALDRNSDSSTSTAERKQSMTKTETTNGYLNGTAKDKDVARSSASSIHSTESTPATTATTGHISPTASQDRDSESIAKLQALLLAEKKKKGKEDTAALQKLEKAIKRDLGSRTSYSKYAVSAGLQDGLFGVCKAYALFDEGVGYAQGMNFLVMPLLFNMPEEEAFCLLVRLMNQYHLREMFIQDMPGLHLHLYQFERLLEEFEPALYCHLHRRGVAPQLYATQWFLTLFAYRLPLQLVLRVYDLIISEGLESAILKFGVVLMQKNADKLLTMIDMSALTGFLKDRLFDVYIDQAPSATSILESGFFGSSGGIDKEVYRADILVQDAYAVKITPEMLKTYAAEWDLKVRLEKERETELEALRSNNASLSLKVRSLEERSEKSDTEHVQIASDLIRTKVDNEDLKDMNESLTGQVAELRLVVERQPEEVEERLKEEMDRIMKRNIEVQDENRALEEEKAEMERQLVNTKMEKAEINSENETLKQKLNDLRKALSD